MSSIDYFGFDPELLIGSSVVPILHILDGCGVGSLKSRRAFKLVCLATSSKESFLKDAIFSAV